MNQYKINLLETQLNDSKNLYKNNINELEIRLTKDFQLKLDKSQELNQNKIILLEKQLNDSIFGNAYTVK